MAVITGLYNTYDTIGIKEDLKDVIWDISPEDTLFLSGIAKTKANQVTHEWQTDQLDAVNAQNAAVEGADAGNSNTVQTMRLINFTQIFSKVATVSGSNEAADAAGRASEMAYQLNKRSKEMKRDIETILLSDQQAALGTNSNARNLGGVFGTFKSYTTGGNNTQVMRHKTDATGNGGLTVADLEKTVQDIYLDGADPNMFMYHASRASDVANFALGTDKQKFTGASETQFANMVSVYIDPLGHNLQCVPSRWIGSDKALVTDLSQWEFAELRPAFMQDLAVNGDSRSKQLLHEATLVHKNQGSSGGIINIGA